jgi:hypothetical protein
LLYQIGRDIVAIRIMKLGICGEIFGDSGGMTKRDIVEGEGDVTPVVFGGRKRGNMRWNRGYFQIIGLWDENG